MDEKKSYNYTEGKLLKKLDEELENISSNGLNGLPFMANFFLNSWEYLSKEELDEFENFISKNENQTCYERTKKQD